MVSTGGDFVPAPQSHHPGTSGGIWRHLCYKCVCRGWLVSNVGGGEGWLVSNVEGILTKDFTKNVNLFFI